MNEPQIYHQARAWLRANRPALPTLSGLGEPSPAPPASNAAGIEPEVIYLSAVVLAAAHGYREIDFRTWRIRDRRKFTMAMGACGGAAQFRHEPAMRPLCYGALGVAALLLAAVKPAR